MLNYKLIKLKSFDPFDRAAMDGTKPKHFHTHLYYDRT